jgi:octaheme c-type cytochrome (tetrathionate reductase family)
MREFKYIWLVGLIVTALIVVVPIALVLGGDGTPSQDPWAGVPQRVPPVDHSALLTGPFASGEEVTRACLDCHEEAGQEMLSSVHFKWEGEPVMLPGRDEPVTIGKKSQLNNFCIGIQSNWPACTSCHAGYGWEDAGFDFTAEEKVDCLVCHDQSGQYVKGSAGRPVDGVDLVLAAQSVSTPTRSNCGTCHFNGGGGEAVKHGDLDNSLLNPSPDVDVHMGRHDFECVDCHRTENHQISGHAISVSPEIGTPLACTDCHAADVHADERINAHVDTVACQTCHVPLGAVRDATKMVWDWSTAGQDIPEDAHVYLKIKGSFVYERAFLPEYAWFNGSADRYILGDTIDPSQVTVLNQPLGDINDPGARIWPFKIHQGRQPYDPLYNILLQVKTAGEGGYWSQFDWDLAARLGTEAAGLPYSGNVGFADTSMYWSLTHMVVPGEQALQCSDCHGAGGRMDWQALGYYGDPMVWGGRDQTIVGMASSSE